MNKVFAGVQNDTKLELKRENRRRVFLGRRMRTRLSMLAPQGEDVEDPLASKARAYGEAVQQKARSSEEGI